MNLSANQKRWIVTGIALNTTVISSARPEVQNGLETVYENLKKNHAVDTQSFTSYLKTWPSGTGQPFKYQNINGNEHHKKAGGKGLDWSKFDYKINNAVDLARLCLLPHMAHLTGFDDTCDGSAVLSLLGPHVPVFSPAIQAAADCVRDRVRNDWAHCNFPTWDEAKFQDCFDDMERLLSTMGLTGALSDLDEWKTKGVAMCMNDLPDEALVKLIQKEAAALRTDLAKITGEETVNILKAISLIDEKLKEMLEHIAEHLETIEEHCERHQTTLEEVRGEVRMGGERHQTTLEEVRGEVRMAGERHQTTLEEVRGEVRGLASLFEQIKIGNPDIKERQRDIVEQFKTHLQRRYTIGEETFIEPLPWMSDTEFTIDKMFTTSRLIPKGKTEDIGMYDVFNCNDKGEKPLNVLVEGSPGIGKTTFCRKLAYDWAKGDIPQSSSFPEFELLLMLKCRDMRSGGIWTAIEEQLLPDELSVPETKYLLFDYIKSKTEKILILMDGYDEITSAANEKNDVLKDIKKILSKSAFSSSSVLVTSRQTAAQTIYKNFQSFLELQGFNIGDALGYVDKYFGSSPEITEEMIEFILVKPILFELLSNPLNAVLLCLVFEDNKERILAREHLTLTELYEEILFCITKRYCQKENIDIDDDTLLDKFRPDFLHMGKFAFDCLIDGTYCFPVKRVLSNDLEKMGFLVKLKSTKKIKPEITYAFPHKSIQDYLAAFYLADRLAKGEVEDVLRLDDLDVYVALNRYDLVGMMGSNNAGCVVKTLAAAARSHFTDYIPESVFTLLCELLAECKASLDYQEIVGITYSCMPSEIDFHASVNFRRRAMSGFSSLLYHKPPSINSSYGPSSSVNQQGNDVPARKSEELRSPHQPLRRCVLDWPQEGDLVGEFRDAMIRNTTISVLGLLDARLSMTDMHVIAEILKKNSFLKELSLRLNDESDVKDGLHAIARSLKYNSTLTTFRVLSTKIDDGVAKVFAKQLRDHPSIKTFKIGGRFGDSGLMAFGKAIQENMHLKKIVVIGSTIGNEGVSAFAEVLAKHDNSLTSVSIMGDTIGDSGAMSIGRALQQNTSIEKIGLISSRGMNFYGLANTDKSELHSRVTNDTVIGDKGACSIARAAANAGSLKSLMIRNNCIGLDGAEALGDLLTKCKSLRVLDINNNILGDAGAVAIAEGLSNNTHVANLRVAHNNIGDEGMRVLAKAVGDSKSLVALDIAGNAITDVGAKALVAACNRSESLRVLVHENNPILNSCDILHIKCMMNELNPFDNYQVTSSTFQTLNKTLKELVIDNIDCLC